MSQVAVPSALSEKNDSSISLAILLLSRLDFVISVGECKNCAASLGNNDGSRNVCNEYFFLYIQILRSIDCFCSCHSYYIRYGRPCPLKTLELIRKRSRGKQPSSSSSESSGKSRRSSRARGSGSYDTDSLELLDASAAPPDPFKPPKRTKKHRRISAKRDSASEPPSSASDSSFGGSYSDASREYERKSYSRFKAIDI